MWLALVLAAAPLDAPTSIVLLPESGAALPIAAGPSTATPAQVLRLLMEAHGMKQADLADIGSQGVVSEILSGKRDLNVRQIARLAQMFHVSPATFFQTHPGEAAAAH